MYILVKMVKMIWHTKQEHKIIRRRGGKVNFGYGYDGIINSRPIEVRTQRKDNRYRIQKDVHKHLIKNKGSYIFVKPNSAEKVVSAERISSLIKKLKRNWYKDRNYPHTFIYRKEVW